MKLTAEIHAWTMYEINGKKWVQGLIFNDRKKRFRDGTYIHTSLILKGPTKKGFITTRNSRYKLRQQG
jgi:hypothetical protein